MRELIEMKLAVFDFDSTLIHQEIIDELAERAGKKEHVARLTRETMEGKHRFADTIHLKTAALAGLSFRDLEEIAAGVTFREGFVDLVAQLKQNGAKIAVVSGSFTNILGQLDGLKGFDDVYANQLVVQGGTLTGQCIAQVSDNKGEIVAHLQKKYGIAPKDTLAVGDGATDIAMFKRAGVSIAFNAKPIVKQNASHAIDSESLVPVLDIVRNQTKATATLEA
ncbi:MAG: phosphoserine phosphatase SerB [Candidatus Micrarchaeota archaeon]|nr:phosphoserine phosphatase SerB [Candidatus Micrarchaeota archaeon]